MVSTMQVTTSMNSSAHSLMYWRPVRDPPLGYRLQTAVPGVNNANNTYTYYPFATRLGKLCFDRIVRMRQFRENEDGLTVQLNRENIGEKFFTHGCMSQPSKTSKKSEPEVANSQNELRLLDNERTAKTIEREWDFTRHGLQKAVPEELFNRHMICDFLNED
ncbi:hypothetical protein D915_003228 [Fasciola hepatica]|uniref:Uncharacterized protein n=1 Tax=Fasciola hepatica TaxID=6192 RepID=A0A4E0S2G7_FASHE|nr:hypothetical protein D915_003228 [Fasciola hepatica]